MAVLCWQRGPLAGPGPLLGIRCAHVWWSLGPGPGALFARAGAVVSSPVVLLLVVTGTGPRCAACTGWCGRVLRCLHRPGAAALRWQREPSISVPWTPSALRLLRCRGAVFRPVRGLPGGGLCGEGPRLVRAARLLAALACAARAWSAGRSRFEGPRGAALPGLSSGWSQRGLAGLVGVFVVGGLG